MGLVWQPELGLLGASVLWMGVLATWTAAGVRGGRRAGPALNVACGAALAGSLVHYGLWPWRPGPFGLPTLTEAEGLPPSRLGAYNAILWGWAAASAGSVLLESPRRQRRWALLGVLTLPALVWSARHHFEWVRGQAVSNPAWWNRAVRAPAPVSG